MTAVSVVFDGTRLSSAESEADGGTWDKWQTTQSPIQETDFVYQGTYSIALKVSNTSSGVDFDYASTVDFTTPKAVVSKVLCSTPGAIDSTIAEGMSYQIGSSNAAYYNYYLYGLYKSYPAAGGWLFLAIDPNVAAYRDATQGSPSLSAINYFGLYADIAVLVQSTNVAHDALDIIDVGTGLTLVGGTGADTDGTFQDFIDTDEGVDTNRWAITSSKADIIYTVGVLTIGHVNSGTVFTDANRVLAFPDGLFDAGFCGIDLNLGNASTNVTIESCTFVGGGREAIVWDFHTNTDVDGTNEEVDIIAHGFQTGDYVDYSKQGGTDVMGLTDGNDYWVRAVTVNSISFHTTRQNAFSDTARVNLTASGGSESHRLTKLTDTRPDFEIIGSTGSGVLDGSSILNFRNVTFGPTTSIDGGRIECKLLAQNSGDISNIVIATSSIPAIATLQDPLFGTSSYLHDVEFVQNGQGHAIELDTATSYTLTNITFTDYGATTSNSAAIYVSATSGTATLNIVGGSSPTYRTAGATVNVVLNPVTTTITVKDITTTSVVTDARVLVEVTDGTNYPYQASVSITSTGGTATVTHSSHGLASNDYVKIRGANEKEYNGVKQITVTGTNTYTYTVAGGPASPATGTIISTYCPVYGTTDGAGQVTGTKSFSTNQTITGVVRSASASPVYKTGSIDGTIDKDSGVSITVQLVRDE